MDNYIHRPVMLREVVENLNLEKAKLVIDCTIGLGGHAEAILKNSKARLIGLDQDEGALEIARRRLSEYASRIDLINDNFRNLPAVFERLNISKPDALLLDLGMSSFQLETGGRGFSFKTDEELDMRMDKKIELSAYDIINDSDEADLAGIFWRYGDERFSRRIAKLIVNYRKNAPIRTTRELADIITESVPYKYRFGRIHPATRSFQALRIYVNDELACLQEGLDFAIDNLNNSGRICVISYHSLEDKIVKDTFKRFKAQGNFIIETKKPLTPSDDEIEQNPRARSAKMRVGRLEAVEAN